MYEVTCLPFTIGWFGEIVTKRALKVSCFYRGGTTNIFSRPIEGVSILIDVESMQIVRFVDRFRAPLPRTDGTVFYSFGLAPDPAHGNGMKTGFTIRGHANRAFHAGFNARAGLVISMVSVFDAGRKSV